MRILQVVTLLSPDGAYGGTARVALNQSAELIDRGHQVTVAAATRGYRYPPAELDGVPVRLFTARTLVPRTRLAGMGAPGLHRWFRRAARDFDLVHIHLARELVVLPVALTARRRGIPYVLQTHGMVVPSQHPLAPLLDAMWTRKILRDAGTVFYLTPLEREQLGSVAGTPLRLARLGNGVPCYPPATETPEPPEILFIARMHPRKRPIAFVEMAAALLGAGVDARFTLVGPDGGEGPALRRAIAAQDPRISWEGALAPDAIPRRLASGYAYVLPAVREPYPMAVLEAMSVGLPVVVTDDCGLAPLVERTQSGIVTDPSVAALAAAVDKLLRDPALARTMGRRGNSAVRTELGMHAIGDRLESVYTEVVGGPR